MISKIEITLEEFKEYMTLKTQDSLLSNQLSKMEFMSGLSILELCQMDPKFFSIDDSNAYIDEIVFKFDLPKKHLRKQLDFFKTKIKND